MFGILNKNKEPRDMDILIRDIMKDMDANRSVDDIIRRSGADEKFVRRVLQIYVTHPGVDVYGIMERL